MWRHSDFRGGGVGSKCIKRAFGILSVGNSYPDASGSCAAGSSVDSGFGSGSFSGSSSTLNLTTFFLIGSI